MKHYNLSRTYGYNYHTDDGLLVNFELCTLGKYKGKTFMNVRSEEKHEVYPRCKKLGCKYNYWLEVVNMDSYKVGDVTIVAEVDVDEHQYEYSEVFLNTARLTKFVGSWDEEEEHIYEGYTYNKHWNGKECPYFDYETCIRILNDNGTLVSENKWECDDVILTYDEKFDTFYEIREYDGETDIAPLGEPHDIDGKHVYDLGNGIWCWDEYEEETEDDI